MVAAGSLRLFADFYQLHVTPQKSATHMHVKPKFRRSLTFYARNFIIPTQFIIRKSERRTYPLISMKKYTTGTVLRLFITRGVIRIVQ